MSDVGCSHLNSIEIDRVPERSEVEGCETCLELGMRWMHLRVCRSCGRIGCCDSSPGQHASKHAAADEHPILSSIEPGEDWSWCTIDEVGFVA